MKKIKKSNSIDEFLKSYPKRVSTVFQNHKGETLILQKLRPILINNQYFFQTVEDVSTKKLGRKVVIFTRNDQGQIISEIEIPNSKLGKFYENEVIDSVPEFIGDKSKIVRVKNDRGEIICREKIQPSMLLLFSQKFEEDLKIDNFKKPIITTTDEIINHQLNPCQYGNDKFQQIVEEIMLLGECEQINVITKNGAHQIVSNRKFFNKMSSPSYYSAITKYKNKKGGQKFRLETRNNNGVILCHLDLADLKHEFNDSEYKKQGDIYIKTLNPISIGERIIIQKIEIDFKEDSDIALIKTYDDYGDVINQTEIDRKELSKKQYSQFEEKNSKFYILTIQGDNDIISVFEIPKNFAKSTNSKIFDKIENLKGKNGFRKATMAIAEKPGAVFRSLVLNPKLIGDTYYFQTINELELNNGQKKAMLLTTNEKGKLIESMVLDNSMISQNYFNKLTQINEEKEDLLES